MKAHARPRAVVRSSCDACQQQVEDLTRRNNDLSALLASAEAAFEFERDTRCQCERTMRMVVACSVLTVSVVLAISVTM